MLLTSHLQSGVVQSRISELLSRATSGESAVLVVGAGVTGFSVSRLLSGAGCRVFVIDEGQLDTRRSEQFSELDSKVVPGFVCDVSGETFLRSMNFACAILSPGVSLESPIAKLLSSLGIPKISELDLGVAFTGMPTVAITGTNGKTTTVTLVHQMLRESKLKPSLAGNVGTPFVDLVSSDDVREVFSTGKWGTVFSSPLVAEVSSYQLEAAYDFCPHIGVWLNLDEDHLDRHGDIDTYLRIKSRVFSGQCPDRDWSILWMDDPYFPKMKSAARGRFLPFGVLTEERAGLSHGCFLDEQEGRIIFKAGDVSETFSLSRWRLLGLHNRLNLLAAMSASRLAGASTVAVQSVINTFQPLPNRLEVVDEVGHVLYVNDSKATNVSSTCAAIRAVRSSGRVEQLVVLLGGKSKEGSWQPVSELLSFGTRAVFAYGQDRDVIASSLGSRSASYLQPPLEVKVCETLDEAVSGASAVSQPGDVVLLAPGCASFDAYKNYEHRGEHFRECVARVSG